MAKYLLLLGALSSVNADHKKYYDQHMHGGPQSYDARTLARFFCDSTARPAQMCLDMSECSAKNMDCVTFGPQRCICGSEPQVPTEAISGLLLGGKSFCDSTISPPQYCQDGTPCTPNYLDCTSAGPQRCICGPMGGSMGGMAGGGWQGDAVGIGDQDMAIGWVELASQNLVPADPIYAAALPSQQGLQGMIKTRRRRFCDSTKGRQKCADGTSCSPSLLDCTSKGPRRCICGSIPIAQMRPELIEMATSSGKIRGISEDIETVPMIPLTTDVQYPAFSLPSDSPRYCDSTASKPQKCKDGTPCSPMYLDCTTKGLNRCVCPPADGSQPAVDDATLVETEGEKMWSGDEVQRTIDAWQPEPDSRPSSTTSTTSQGFGGTTTTSKSGLAPDAPRYCDSTADKPQKCKDGTPCSPMYLDCTTKGLNRCVCPPLGGMPGQDLTDMETAEGDWQQIPLDTDSSSSSSSSIGEWQPIPLDSSETSKSGLAPDAPRYCDSTADKPQKCKDGTPCSPMYLDCTTKGLSRCVCPPAGGMSDQGGRERIPIMEDKPVRDGSSKSSTGSLAPDAPRYCDSTADKPQKCKDGTPCSPMYLDCTTKGLSRCVCPSAGGAQDSMGDDMSASSDPFGLGSDSRSGEEKDDHKHRGHCDSTAKKPQYCKDGTLCSSRHLDCTSKGPKRCVCPQVKPSSIHMDPRRSSGRDPRRGSSQSKYTVSDPFGIEKEKEDESYDPRDSWEQTEPQGKKEQQKGQRADPFGLGIQEPAPIVRGRGDPLADMQRPTLIGVGEKEEPEEQQQQQARRSGSQTPRRDASAADTSQQPGSSQKADPFGLGSQSGSDPFNLKGQEDPQARYEELISGQGGEAPSFTPGTRRGVTSGTGAQRDGLPPMGQPPFRNGIVGTPALPILP